METWERVKVAVQASRLLLSHFPTFPHSHLATSSVGGVFSVALSLGSRPVAVSHHRALCSSDFPPAPRHAQRIVRADGSGGRLAHSAIQILPPKPPRLNAVIGFRRHFCHSPGELCIRPWWWTDPHQQHN